MKLSIVATLYKSASYIEEFCRRAGAVAENIADSDYEIILVNDGSPDNSLQIAADISAMNSHLVVVDLSRNFGHHKAMMTGLSYARGDLVFLIDSDLEEQPEWLLSFAEQLKRDKCDVVYGVQEVRKGSAVERVTGKWFYWLFNVLTSLPLPENIVTARLMTLRYVRALLTHEEREICISGLWYLTGFEQRAQTVKKLSLSETTYTFPRKMSLLVNAITSVSSTPLVAIFYVGILIFLFAASYAGYLIIHWTFFAKPLSGWTSVMASIWLLGGLVISFIGVVGIYLSKIYVESKRRPYTIVRHVYGDHDSKDGEYISQELRT